MPPIRERMRPLPAGDVAPHELLARPRSLEDPPSKAGLDDHCCVALATDRFVLGHHIDVRRVHISNASAALQATVKDNRSGSITYADVAGAVRSPRRGENVPPPRPT